MAGLYSHTTRADGLTLTAAIYNSDHQNHINNHVPSQMDDYSSNVTQMQSQTDPGEDGSESQATSLAGEIERLRFAIKEIKNVSATGIQYWYESPSVGLNDITEHYALVGVTGSISVSGGGANYTIPWDTEAVDTDSIHSTGNLTRLTVPAGYTAVRVSAQLSWAANNFSPRKTWQMDFQKNGSGAYDGRTTRAYVGPTGAHVQVINSPILEVTSGDYFELVVNHTGTGPVNINNSRQNWCHMELLR